MNNKNNERVCKNALTWINKVTITGIDEANTLVECAVLLDKLAKGELMIVSAPMGKEDPKGDSTEEN